MKMKRKPTNLSLAFKELRNRGYFAKQNFMCCQSCGWAAIREDKADRAVFSHAQDHADYQRGDDLYLSWSGNGHEIVRVLESFGIAVDWDGSESNRIVVKNNSII